MDKWIRHHPHMNHSPMAKDTGVLVKDDSSNELVRKTKLIVQHSIRNYIVICTNLVVALEIWWL